jgi:hypothetical protein
MLPKIGARFKACCIHFLISSFVATGLAAFVFLIWYPYPYRDISGGGELFFLLVLVDIVLGPMLTFIVFSPSKKLKELRTDLLIIAVFQITAFSYGLWVVASARPVHLVFEIDRFRVVHATEIPIELLENVPAGIKALPWTGPTTLSIRGFKTRQESSEMTLAALQGLNLAFRPELWQSYESGIKDVKKTARSLDRIQRKFPQYESLLNQALHASGHAGNKLSVLPLVARNSFWTVLLDSDTGQIVAILPIDTFE